MITLAIAAGLVAVLYWYLTRNFDYWQKRGVKHDKPVPIFGNNAKNYLMQASVLKVISEAYNKYPDEKVIGFFRGSTPQLIIKDLNLAKRILIGDFLYFHRRGLFPAGCEIEPLQKHQFAADDDLWRLLRLRMTPAFSSGKLKAMFPLIIERTERLQHRLETIVDQEQAVDARDLMACFTTDVIATVGFGVVADSLNNKDDPFRELGRKILNLSFLRILKATLRNVLPGLFGHLKILDEVEPEVKGMVQAIMRQRNCEPIGRHDFVDLLLECKKKGAMTGDSIVEMDADGKPKRVSMELDDTIMAAQCLVFFAAGFETSSSTTSYTLHQLAHNPLVQQKVQKEIDRVLANHNYKLSYDAVSEMTYLRWCLDEALRMFPPVGVLQRSCVRSYTFPGTNVTIDPGANVLIPVDAYQHDPKIFPEPKEFRPERFDPAVMTEDQKLAHLPFGSGPRACIGERLGLMQSMAGLAAVLAKFSVRPAPGAPRDPVVNPRAPIVQILVGGLPLIFTKRKVL